MQQTCTQCSALYEVTDADLAFLQRVSPTYGGKTYPIPAPVLCPDCRLQSRLVHRNERRLYNSVSSLSGKSILSLVAPVSAHGRKYKVYTQEEWWGDAWNGTDYGREFDFNRPFFEQFQELALEIPLINVVGLQNENCDYAAIVAYCKNCYLINASENSEDCYYGHMLQRCRKTVDSSDVYDSELVYEGFNLHKCNSCTHLSNSTDCRDCHLSDNLRGCNDCFLCTNLVRRQYCFLNQQLTKEDYLQRVRQVRADPRLWQEALARLDKLRSERVHKYANITNSEDCTGDFINASKDCHDSYDISGCQDCRFVTTADENKDLMDCSNMFVHCELGYQVMSSISSYHCAMNLYCYHGHDVYYSMQCWNSSNLFGCVGLKKDEYCILNKQYTKAEYDELVPRIIAHMQKSPSPLSKGGGMEWGKFFPASLSPYAYNETVAHEYFPLDAPAARKIGADWRGEDDTNRYQGPKVVIPERIEDVSDTITDEILGCSQCGKNYKVIRQELRFYREMGLPAPTRCWNCRYDNRLGLRNPRRLFDRTCSKCAKPIRSTYSPERSGNVYCEECYLAEVY